MNTIIKLILSGSGVSIGVMLITSAQEVFGNSPRFSIENILQTIISIVAVIIIYNCMSWGLKKKRKE